MSPFEFEMIRFMNSINFNSTIRVYLRFSLILFALVHISGCIWHYISSGEDLESWIVRYDYQNKSNFERYIGSIYFILTVLFTIGYGNIVPVTSNEKLFVIVFMFIGVLVFGYTLAYLTNLNYQTNAKQNQLQVRNEFFEQAFFQFSYPRALLEKNLLASSKADSINRGKVNLLVLFNSHRLLRRLPKNLLSSIIQHIFRNILLKFEILQDKS